MQQYLQIGSTVTSYHQWKPIESGQQPEDADAHEQSVEALTNELDHNLSDEDITNWMKKDSSNPGYQLLTDKEIIQQVMNPSAE